MRTLLATLVVLLAPATAFAFDLEHDADGQSIRWNGPVTFRLDPAARDLAEPDVVAAIQRAAQNWVDVAGVQVGITVESGHGEPGYHDGEANQNEIFFVGDEWEYDDSVVATTLVTSDSSSHQIIDTDILINEAQHRFGVLADDSEAGAGLSDDLEATVTHELGHALGLAHNAQEPTATMYPSTLPGEVTKRRLAQDDIAGVQQLYGAASDPKSPELPNVGCTAGLGSDGLLALLAAAAIFARRKLRKTALASAATLALVAALTPASARAEGRVEQRLEGEVLQTTSAWEHGRIYTLVEVRVTRCHEGSCPDRVTYRVPGGTVGTIQQQLGEIRVPDRGAQVQVALGRAKDGMLRVIPEPKLHAR